ncbi:hypothetical protein H072_7423 [Dactylellina haptotyla CBS 200.50]|uniref:Uncharacterized protein n=1 Tax=Dactylellina haptotyla (strain CBS 200.50) TaxID=1284197 RepID=S8BHH8_DACHA|nr:hypothetical protein H072_7423 [Dactylellina haptotyla CBS 200.50]
MAVAGTDSVTARLRYLSSSSASNSPQLFQYMVSFPDKPDGPWTNIQFTAYNEPIRNIRNYLQQFNLDDQGFQLVKHMTSVKDLKDTNTVETKYFAECTAFLTSHLGAKYVKIFDCSFRKSNYPPTLGPDFKFKVRPPSPMVHVAEGAARRLRFHLPEQSREILQQQCRYQIINIWRPLVDTVIDYPMTMCDYSTVSTSDALTVDLFEAGYCEQMYYFRHSPEHKWYYVKEQTKDEILLIKCFDSGSPGIGSKTDSEACPPSVQGKIRFFETAFLDSELHKQNLTDLSAYLWRIQQQASFLDERLFSKLRTKSSSIVSISDDINILEWIFEIASAVVSEILKPPAPTINRILEELKNSGLLDEGPDDPSWSLFARQGIFAVIGYLTMLYNPTVDDFEPDVFRLSNRDCIDKNIYDHTHQDVGCSKQSMLKVLKGFGTLLPPEAENLTENPSTDIELRPAAINAHLLQTLGKVTFRWVDTLPLHFFTTESANHDYWLPSSGLQQYLSEILLSYRLLFGQDPKSRQLFRRLNPFSDYPKSITDNVLVSLCQKTQTPDLLSNLITEKRGYSATDDFAYFRDKLLVLTRLLEDTEPGDVLDVWMDKRNLVQWYTFFAVMCFGGGGLLLAITQTILAGLQLRSQASGSN